MGKMNEGISLNVHICFLAVGASVIATDAWLKWGIVRGDDIPIDCLVEISQAKHLSSIRKAW